MKSTHGDSVVTKSLTGIEGFDLISNGGLPTGRTTLVVGTAGSAKTVFAAQFLVEGATKHNEHGVFVTFEETAEDIRRNIASLGWNVDALEASGQWAFVDASRQPDGQAVQAGAYDLGALIARIEHAVRKIGAKRVSLDSLGAIFTQFGDSHAIRGELFRIAWALKKMGVTSVLTSEREEDSGRLTCTGIEEFVADNVIVLRNMLENTKRRRTIEILKFRGTSHHKGEFPFTILPSQGLVIVPLSAIDLKQRSSYTRVTSGNEELDKMCGGGFFRDSIVLVSGPTGTGKTLTVTQFLAGGCDAGERCLMFAFEESREQLYRNAQAWDSNFDAREREGCLKIVCQYPESGAIEDHLVMMKRVIEEFKPQRIAIDSLSALERVSNRQGFREFIIDLTSFIKMREILGLFTSTTQTLTGGDAVTQGHISTITDSILLLRYVEMYGEMRRGIMVLKMRGSMHDKEIREFFIDGTGMHIQSAFRNVAGILRGDPRQVSMSELERVQQLFQEGPSLGG